MDDELFLGILLIVLLFILIGWGIHSKNLNNTIDKQSCMIGCDKYDYDFLKSEYGADTLRCWCLDDDVPVEIPI